MRITWINSLVPRRALPFISSRSMSSNRPTRRPIPCRLSRVVAGALRGAEAWSSCGLLETGRALRGERMITMTPIPARRVFDRVARQMETEARLRGMTLDLKTSDLPPDAVVRGDESLLAIAVSSMALETPAIVGDVPHARVALSVSSRPSGSVVFDLYYD